MCVVWYGAVQDGRISCQEGLSTNRELGYINMLGQFNYNKVLSTLHAKVHKGTGVLPVK